MKSLRGFSRGLNIQWSAVASCIGVRPKREVSTSETFISSSPEEGDTDFPRGFIRGEIPPREVSQGERGVKVRTGKETFNAFGDALPSRDFFSGSVVTVAGEVAGGGIVREMPYGAALTLCEAVETPSPCDTPPVQPNPSPRFLLPYPKLTPSFAPVVTGAPNNDALVTGADTMAGTPPKSDEGAAAPREGVGTGCAAAPNVPPPLKALDAGTKEKAGVELTVGVREGPAPASCPPNPPKLPGVVVGVLESPPNGGEDAGLAPNPELVVAARAAEPKKLPAGAVLVVAPKPKVPPAAEVEAHRADHPRPRAPARD